mmetsp:Transcript_12326/g.23580  ORF Transcript_12326/g.23580 Transcript_12326/m.23580 type:complete len:249 (-) Transcript_12326:28-774(-)|eukprot:scaffold2655_cov179-Amphora_coffeaeformis.AAC.30
MSMLAFKAFVRSYQNSGRLVQKCCLSTASPSKVDHFVFADKAPAGYDGSAVVYSDVITEEEESTVLLDLKEFFKRRRYESGHWDAVIVKYKETELFNETDQLSPTSRNVLRRIREHLMAQGHVATDITWLPSHAIELHPEGELRAHVDSVRFSGGLVAGLSLGCSSIMRLQPSKEETSKDNHSSSEDDNQGYVDLFLPPRSLYALTGKSRYDYTHELLRNEAIFSGSGEAVNRDKHRWSIIFRDSKGD